MNRQIALENDKDILLSLAPGQPLFPEPTGVEPAGRLYEPVQAVLFDVYGTLFISAAGDIAATRRKLSASPAIERLLNELGINRPAEQLLADFFSEIEAAGAGQIKKGVDYPEVNIDAVWQTVLDLDSRKAARQFALVFEMTVNPVYPMPGAPDLLEKIKGRKITAGIISNAQFYTPLIFEHFFGARPEQSWAREDLIFYSYLWGVAKPSCYLFERAAAVLEKKGIPAGKTLYVGNDMGNDILPAKSCGFKTALFAGDARSLRLRKDEPQCAGLKSDLVVTALDQLEARLPDAKK